MIASVDLELVVWCEAIKPGCTFVARTYDRVRGEFYSGAGDTALEAIAWCLHDFVARGLLGHPPSLARSGDAKPGDGLVPAPSSRTRRITPAPIVTGPVLASDESAKAQCFEQQIPRPAEPRLFGLQLTQAPTPTTRPRRARGGR